MALPSKLLAAVAAAFGLSLSAHAQPADGSRPPSQAPCSAQPRYPLPAAHAELRELAARLETVSAEPGCLSSAFFHAWRGAVLLALGDHAAAIEPLERALLTQPDLPAAQLDLALALAATGDTRAASALLDQLRGRNDLPPAVRAGLDRQGAASAVMASASRWYSRWQLTSLLGADSNLNNAPSISELTLTLPGEIVTLPLAPGSLPKPGAAMLNTLQWQGVRSTGPSLWLVQGELRARLSREGATHYQQGDFAATWLQAPDAPSQWVGRVALTHLRFGGNSLVQSARAGLQYQWPRLAAGTARLPARLADCRPAAGLESEGRHYPGAAELDGTYQGLGLALLCSWGRAPGASFVNLHVRAGQDGPRNDGRPGGAQVRREFRAQWEMPVSSPWAGVLGPGRLGLQWASTAQRDGSGYSPLLENNAARRITRHAVQAEASFSLGGGLSAVANAEASVQRSNISAFGARQRSVYLGLRWELM